MRLYWLLLIVPLWINGCASSPQGQLGNKKTVSVHLNKQLMAWKGTPYVLGGNSQKGIDCSAFVQTTYRQRFSIQLPRTTRQQITVGTKVSRNNLQSGDLIFFKTGTNTLHVGIYDKNGQFIHASTSKGVTRSSLNNQYWKKRYWQARRI